MGQGNFRIVIEKYTPIPRFFNQDLPKRGLFCMYEAITISLSSWSEIKEIMGRLLLCFLLWGKGDLLSTLPSLVEINQFAGTLYKLNSHLNHVASKFNYVIVYVSNLQISCASGLSKRSKNVFFCLYVYLALFMLCSFPLFLLCLLFLSHYSFSQPLKLLLFLLYFL